MGPGLLTLLSLVTAGLYLYSGAPYLELDAVQSMTGVVIQSVVYGISPALAAALLSGLKFGFMRMIENRRISGATSASCD
jgi:hypothetical protein